MPESKLSEGARQFAIKMKLGAYKEAARIKSDLGLPNEMLQEAAVQAYEANMKKGDFSLAADLARQYDLPADLRNEAALRSFHRKIDSEFFRAAADYAKEFGLPEETVREECKRCLRCDLEWLQMRHLPAEPKPERLADY